jgi:hypothetical protein
MGEPSDYWSTPVTVERGRQLTENKEQRHLGEPAQLQGLADTAVCAVQRDASEC